MLLCEHCIKEKQGEGKIVIYDRCNYIECKEAENMNTPCEWCYLFDDLFKCDVYND